MSISNNLLLQIKLAVAIAVADNEFIISEEKTIKKWFESQIENSSASQKNKLLKDLDTEISRLRELAKSGQLELELVFYEINNIDDRSFKYDALDLSIEVMVADSTIHPNEVKLIEEIIEELGLKAIGIDILSMAIEKSKI